MKEKLIKKTRKVANIIALISLVFNATMFGVFAPEVAKAGVVVGGLVINEIDYDQSGTDTAEFIELKNSSTASVNLDTYELRLINAAASSIPYGIINLPNVDIASSEHYVICSNSSTVANCDLDVTPDINLIQNGDPDAIVLWDVANNFSVDTVSYAGDTIGYTEGTGAQDDLAGMAGMGLSRIPDGQDTNNNSTDFVFKAITPGAVNNTAPTVPVLTSPVDGAYLNYNNPIFSWNPSTDADGNTVQYGVWVYGPNGFWENFSAISPYPHAALPYDGEYTWYVEASDGYEHSLPSSTFTFTIDTVKPEITNVSVSPNPFSPNGDMQKDVTTVSYTVNEAAENLVRIRDIATDELLWQSSKYDQSAGTHSIDWDGTVDRDVLTYSSGDTVAEGSYLVAVQSKDLAGNIKRNRTQTVEVDITGPVGTYESVIDATNPTNNNNPTVYGKYYGTTAVADVFATPSDGSIVTDIVSIKVVFEKNYLDTNDVNTQGIATRYWKPGYVDGLGQYTTHGEDLYVCEGCPFDSSSVRAQIVPVITSDVLPDGSYKVYVQSFDNAGNSTIEPIESAQVIDTTAPAVVTNLVVTGKTNTSVSLKWDAVSDAAGYKVYYGTQEGVFTGVKSVGNVTSYTVSGLLANTNYFFKVVAYDAAMNDSLTSNIVADKTNETQVVLAATSSVGSVSSAGATAPEGAIAGATDEKTEEGVTEDEDKNKEEDKNKGFNWFWVILLLILAGGGYYYYTINPAFFKRFGKGPTPPSGI